MTAGAVISGAYFGDKMSPLSDTTNLASAISGTDLYTHIKVYDVHDISNFYNHIYCVLYNNFKFKQL